MSGLLTALTTAVVLLASLQCTCVTADGKSSGPRSSGVDLVPSVPRYINRPAPIRSPSRHQRRIPQLSKPPPYAVQMEPLVQYSQRDPLYQEAREKFSSGPSVFVNHHGSGGQVPHASHQSQIYVTPQPDYYGSSVPPGYVVIKEPEPIIEIIVKEANHSLPPEPTQAPEPKKREPVHVFFVKYKKDEQSGNVKYDKPIAAITPASTALSSSDHHGGLSEDHHVEYTTPGPPPPSTTLRTVIHPDSETIHVNTGGLRITFGGEEHQHSHGNHYGAASNQNPTTHLTHHATHEQQQGSEPQPAFIPTPEQRPQPTKRQQPAGPSPRFNFPPTQSRFLTPPPIQQSAGDFRSPLFQSFQPFPPRPNFSNQPQFTNKLQPGPFQQNFDSFSQQSSRFEPSGKLEAVPFKQQSTGKLIVPNSSGRFEPAPFSQSSPPFQNNLRIQEPINGLPPPPPPQTFLRQQPPTFFSPQFNQQQPRPAQHPARPPPSSFSQQTFSQPLPPTFSQTSAPQLQSFPQTVPPQSSPSFSKPQNVPQQQSFSQFIPQPPPKHTQQPPVFTAGPVTLTTTPVPPTTRHQQFTNSVSAPSGPEIIQSLSPTREELQRQQQEQFRREQEYYQEIQKIQKELEERAKTTAAPPAPTKSFSTSTTRQQNVHNFAPSSTTTTPAPSVSSSTTRAPSNFVLPDEVPEDLRQQLLSSGILSNADIQILDYDKVGDIPIESLPQEALQQFVGATGGQVPAASEVRPQYVPAPVKRVSSVEDSEPAASEPERKTTQNVEVKVVRFPPGGEVDAASRLVRQDESTKITEPVELNDESYSRYLPLQVAGNRFPLPNVPELVGRNITSVVVLAPVETQLNSFSRRVGSAANVAEVSPDDVQFVAGETLTNLVQDPSERNFRLWLEREKETQPSRQSVILLVSDKPRSEGGQDVFMYDAVTQRVNRLEGELSSQFIEVALANSNSQEPEPADEPETTPSSVSISTSYSKTKN